MSRWHELSLRGRAETWRSLRGRRATPPTPGASPARAATFRAALEQAEQQFKAAEAVGMDSRALNLFYGLSQAGRAIAASSSLLPDGDWQLRGHGLHLIEPGALQEFIGRIHVQTKGGDATSFRRLSTVLGSHQPSLVTLGELWPLMYDTLFGPNLGDPVYAPMEVRLEQTLQIGAFPTCSAALTLPSSVTSCVSNEVTTEQEFLGRYPALHGYLLQQPVTPAQPVPPWPPTDGATAMLWWQTPNDVAGTHVLDGKLTRYRGADLVYPALEGADATVHPLMAWWMTLFALSMLTRYSPDAWTRLIDVDVSPYATAIEYVLETALDAVPDLIDETIASQQLTPASGDGGVGIPVMR